MQRPSPQEKKIATYVWSVKTNAAAKGRHQVRVRTLWQYGLSSFQAGGIKLERFLPKNQHAQRKFLNFENWTNGEPQ